jgi:hypothetical protein
MYSNRELDTLETSSHIFEIIRLEKVSDFWRCQMAIDGIKAPEFIEPHAHVAEMHSDEFLTYMKSQSLGMLEYSLQNLGQRERLVA